MIPSCRSRSTRAFNAVGGMSAEVIDRTRLKRPAIETHYIKPAMYDNMSTRAISRHTIARFQPTVNTEALAAIPAFSAASSP